MSIELDWPQVTQELADGLRDRLNAVLAEAPLPSFMGPVHIHTLAFGTDAPDVELQHLGDLWPEFREAVCGRRMDSRASTPPTSRSSSRIRTPTAPMRMRTFRQYDTEAAPVSVHCDSESSEWGDEDSLLRWSETDSDAGCTESLYAPSEPPEQVDSTSGTPSVQAHLGVQWVSSTVRLHLTTTLQIHHGDTPVMALPMTLTLTGFELSGQVILALDGDEKCLYVTLCERGDGETPSGVRTRHKAARILPFLTFDSRIGEPTKHVLENVGKVERFCGDVVRQLLDAELVFPNFYTLALPE